jgi:hypothetical protein
MAGFGKTSVASLKTWGFKFSWGGFLKAFLQNFIGPRV